MRFSIKMVKKGFDLVKSISRVDKNYLLCTRKMKQMKKALLLTIFFGLIFTAVAQESKNSKRVPKQAYPAATKLSKSLEEAKPDSVIAREYTELAKSLAGKASYAKAEEYFGKALQLYTKLKQKDKIAEVSRELAKVQEAQGKNKQAEQSFEKAATIAKDEVFKQLNTNDASRLQNADKPKTQAQYMESNIAILESTGQRKEATVVAQKMADAYVADEQYEKAIEVNTQLVQESKAEGDVTAAIGQLQSLSEAYFKEAESKANVSPELGVEALQQAYSLAVENAQTQEAKHTTELLAAHYQKQRDSKSAVKAYQRFFEDLDQLIRADSSLVDAKLFAATEERITQLEKERELQDELIDRQNTFNYTLLGLIVVMLLLLIVIIRAFYSIKKGNRQIALQSLRREMNPHFIFNSLNSINHFIAQNNELAANKYLTSYSKLMRTSMENSNNDFIKLSNELDLLREYLDLEHLRFNEKFSYEIIVDEQLDAELVYIPNMLLQPHLENAVWHGLRYKEGRGMLRLSVMQEGETVVIAIDDNGIGLQQSKAMKTANQKVYHSRGLSNINERIKLLNKLYHMVIEMTIAEKQFPETGVVVTLRVPKKNN